MHIKAFVRLTEAEAAAGSLEPDVPETVCDNIKKVDCKDIPKLPLKLPVNVSVAVRTPHLWRFSAMTATSQLQNSYGCFVGKRNC